MVLESQFRGLVAPAFTPFDDIGQVNTSQIQKYAQYLSGKNVNAVLVNGTVSEGALLSNEERKLVTETWAQAAKSTRQKLMVHVGVTNLNNVIQLAKHAESLGVWAILCLPDMFFKPTTIAELIDYLKIVSSVAPNTQLFYYHYPALTGVTLDMVEFLDAAYSEVPTLAGLKYTHNNLDEGVRCVQLRDRAYAVFLGCDQLVSAAIFMGFDSFILTALNFAADQVHQIKKYIDSGDNLSPRAIQKNITELIYFITEQMHFISGFKMVISLVSGTVSLGNPRPPLKSLTQQQQDKLISELKKAKWI